MVTHPFHPLVGQRFPLLWQRRAWGEARVAFQDPGTGQVRSLPLAWTDLASPDPFIELAAGRAVLRLSELRGLVRLLSELAEVRRNPPHL